MKAPWFVLLAACAAPAPHEASSTLRIKVGASAAEELSEGWTRASDLGAALALAEQAGRPCEIALEPGRHVLHAGLRIGAAHPPLVVRAAAPGASIVGGLAIDAPRWEAVPEAQADRLAPGAREHVRLLRLPAAELAAWDGGIAGPVHSGHGVAVDAVHSELLVGGRALRLAAWPDDGWASLGELLDAGSVPRDAEPDIPPARRKQEAPRGGAFRVKDAGHAARWALEPRLWAHGYWNWDWSDEQLPVAGVQADGRVELAMPHRYGLASRGKWRMVGALCDLDTPGECRFDPEAGVVHAWLPDGAADAPCFVTLLGEPLLALDGAQDVRFEGLVFEGSRGSAITGRGVRRVAIERCTFRDLGARGVVLEGEDVSIRATLFEDLGGTGADLSGGDRPTLAPSRNSIEDCVFRRTARLLRTYEPAVRLAGVGTRVAHNELQDLPHFALMAAGNDHVVEANLVHHVVQETGDAGALYWGRDWTVHGNVVRGNVFHDIRGSDARYQNAVYLDDMASGILVEGNLHVRCNWGALVGGGRDNVLRDNAYVLCGQAVVYDARGVGWMADAIAEPSTSTILQRYAAMPVAREPWSTRFPTLSRYLDDRRGRPVGGRVEGMLLANSAPGRIDDRECVLESGTVRLEERDDAEAWADALLERVRGGSATVGGRSFGPAGPRTRSGAP